MEGIKRRRSKEKIGKDNAKRGERLENSLRRVEEKGRGKKESKKKKEKETIKKIHRGEKRKEGRRNEKREEI